MSMDVKRANEVLLLTKLLEKYTHKNVTLIDKENLNEVKRTKLTQPFQVERYVKELLFKYGLKQKARVTLKGNYIKVEDESTMPDAFNYQNVAFELMENGYNPTKNKKVNDKTYSQLIDSTTNIIVLLPYYKN